MLRLPTRRADSNAGGNVTTITLTEEEEHWVDRVFEQDGILPDDVQPAPNHGNRQAPENVLLIGSTGVVGPYLLREILARTSATVHCVSRAGDHDAGIAHLRESLDRYGIAGDIDWSRVQIVPGNIAKPRFAIAGAEYDALADRIDMVFHNAAWTNHIRPVLLAAPTRQGRPPGNQYPEPLGGASASPVTDEGNTSTSPPRWAR